MVYVTGRELIDLEGDALSLWMQKQLKPLCRVFGHTSPETFGWMSLGVSLCAGGMLYSSADNHWMALAVVPMLMLRLALDSIQEMLFKEADASKYAQILSRLCDRLADLTIFLGVSFWPGTRIHLSLLAIASMLIVSYTGELGRSVGADTSGGMLCKTHRTVLLMVFCAIHALRPGAMVMGFSPFETMFLLFIPLASLTMLQRLEVIMTQLGKSRGD